MFSNLLTNLSRRSRSSLMMKVMKSVDIESNSLNTKKIHQRRNKPQSQKRKRQLKKLKKKKAVKMMMMTKTLRVTRVIRHLDLILTQTVKKKQSQRKSLKISRPKTKMSLQVVVHHHLMMAQEAAQTLTQMRMVVKYLTMMKTMISFKLKESFQLNTSSC